MGLERTGGRGSEVKKEREGRTGRGEEEEGGSEKNCGLRGILRQSGSGRKRESGGESRERGKEKEEVGKRKRE